MSWESTLGRLFGWIPWLIKRAAGVSALEARLAKLEEEAARDRIDKVENSIGILTYALKDLTGKTERIEDRVRQLEVMSKVVEHRLDDVTDDVSKLRDRVLRREFRDGRERDKTRLQLERMLVDLGRMLETIKQVRSDLKPRAEDQSASQILAALLRMSNAIGGKKNTINSLLGKLGEETDEANPTAVAA